MKRLTLCLSILIMMSAFMAPTASALGPTPPIKSITSVEAQVLVERLKELKWEDRATLSRRVEKKLRKEMHFVSYHADEPGGGAEFLISLAPLLAVITLIIIIL